MCPQLKKGIILAGGDGTRMFPVTQVICKQLLPVYDKPMIYYPLSTLMLLGIKEILLISTSSALPLFQSLLGDGQSLGISISYKVQEKPQGIAQAFLIGEEFISNNPVALILGDNIFYGDNGFLLSARAFTQGALVFGYKVKDPHRYGVVEFNSNGSVISIEEKPQKPKSNYAITGLYLYDSKVVAIAKTLKPSTRGELEITDINQAYFDKNQLQVVRLGQNTTWLDTGTHDSLLDAGNFVADIEKRQGQKIACIEEIAYRMKYIDKQQMKKIIDVMNKNSYKEYLDGVVKKIDGKEIK